MGAGRRLLCFSIFIIITRKKMKGCCFIKFRDDAIFPLFFLSISSLPLFHKCYCAGFHSGAFIHRTALWGGETERNRSLIRNRRWSSRTEGVLFLKQCSENEVEVFNLLGLGSEHKCRNVESRICLPLFRAHQ